MKPTRGLKIVIVGLGAAGGVLFGKLAEAGFDVLGLEAGPHWVTEKDFVSDEREMEKLKWNHARISGGNDPLDIGSGTSGKGVGGGTVHYTMMSLRLRPSDFKTKTLDGVGVDWPFEYAELEPYYSEIEDNLPVSGPEEFPWPGRGRPYVMPAKKLSCMDEIFRRGAEKIGLKVAACPLALATRSLLGRQPCISRGFCEQGCLPKAKSSTLITYIPRGLKAGGKIIDRAMVTEIKTDLTEKNVTGVAYLKDGKKFTVDCDLLILAAFAIETPRLLLNHKSRAFPHGLANSSGAVGRYLMCHSDHIVFGKFKEPLRVYRNPPVTSICQDFYETDRKNDFVRGFSIAPYQGRPISFALAALAGRSDLYGEKLAGFMTDYNFWLQLGIIGEVLPNADNRVELTAETDDLGLPIPKTTFSLGLNDRRLIDAGYRRMEKIMAASGAEETFRAPLFVHLMGTARLGDNPADSVVDANLKAHDLANLYICGTPVFPTGGAVNPTLTVEALAARLAEHLKTHL